MLAPRYPRRVDRICPYLALADDGRTVADGFDPEHRCHALAPPAPLERSRQVQLCLTEAHARCERFAAARTAWLAASSGLPRVSPDVDFGRTRLVLEPEAAWRSRSSTSGNGLTRPAVLVAAIALAVVALLVLSSVFGILSGPSAADSPTPSPSASPSASPLPSASVAPASTMASPSVAPASVPAAETPAPTPRTYIVQQGDTLNEIAAQFGTTAEAIRVANGLTGDTLDIGQVLIIP